MSNFKLTLAYDGTGFVGWQRQARGLSIQGLLEDALATLDGAPVVVFGAGRTDAGVHALGQVASAALRRSIDAVGLRRAVNAHLPDSIRVLDVREVPDDFHARFAATSKTYRYRIWNAEVLSPFESRFAWHIPSPRLDVDAMAQAAVRLRGWHDFSAFQTAGAETRTAERELFACAVCPGPDAALITLELSGTGFLRHMVRSIAGTLVEIGRGRQPASWMDAVLASKSRASAGQTAPAAGLFLVRVGYQGPDL